MDSIQHLESYVILLYVPALLLKQKINKYIFYMSSNRLRVQMLS